MNTPDPVPPEKPPTRWKPHQSVVGGAVVGTSAAQLVIAALQFFLHTTITPMTGGAITSLCLFTATYFIPDKPEDNS